MSTLHPVVRALEGTLIVSCQAYPGEPMRDPRTMAQIAVAVEEGGASAVRAQGLEDIEQVKASVQRVPVIGTWMHWMMFGGDFPGDIMIPRFYVLHVLIIPAIILALIAAHLALARDPPAPVTSSQPCSSEACVYSSPGRSHTPGMPESTLEALRPASTTAAPELRLMTAERTNSECSKRGSGASHSFLA